MSRLTEVRSERGASLIAAIFLVVMVGFFGTIAFSLVGTQSSSALNETQSSQAVYIAEGGLEFSQRIFAQNLDFYRSSSDPIAFPSSNLGGGSFAVNAYLPVTLLRARIPDGPTTANIHVYTTGRFPVPGDLLIDDDLGGAGEFIHYTGTSGGNAFTGISRDRTIGGFNGAGASHERSSRVYPVTTLSTALLNNIGGTSCTPTPLATSVAIVAHTKFLLAGTISLFSTTDPSSPEEIGYASSTTSGPTMTLTGVTRCLNGTSSAHAVGTPVTPLVVDDEAPDFEVNLLSTGTVGSTGLGNAVRVVGKTVQR